MKKRLFTKLEIFNSFIYGNIKTKLQIFVWIDQINITLYSNLSTKASQTASNKRHNCVKNFLELYDGSTALKHQRYHFCSSENNKFFKSQTNKIFIRYNLEEKPKEKNTVYFKLTFNPYETGSCKNGTFHCSDNTCVNETLVCNNVKNCKFLDDESNCRELILAKKQVDESRIQLLYRNV